jgi:hemolysin D
MTSGPVDPNPNSSALPPEATNASSTENDDLLLGGANETKPPAASESQKPRGQRQRRTTLPRSTRGWSRAIVWSLISLTGFSAVYGLLARIDSSIEAAGKLRPAGGVFNLSSPFNSLVQRVLVREGQQVRAGQPMVLLRDESLEKQRRELLAIRASWRKEVTMLSLQLGLPVQGRLDPTAQRQLEVGDFEVRLRVLAALEESARNALNTRQQLSDLAGLRQKLAINKRITERLRPLQESGAISQLELDRQLERELEVETAMRRTELEAASGRRRENEGSFKVQQISAANSKQLFTTLDNARNQLRDVESRLVELDERLALSTLRTPVAGRVFDLSVRRGELASPARPVLRIVPEGALEASVDISNKDIGFVKKGMPVEVRVASFPFTDYGSLKGILVRLSDDAQPADATHPQEYFQATIRLNSSVLRRNGIVYTLRPGMAVTALLQLGPRPVISLLTDRFNQFFDSTRTIR